MNRVFQPAACAAIVKSLLASFILVGSALAADAAHAPPALEPPAHAEPAEPADPGEHPTRNRLLADILGLMVLYPCAVASMLVVQTPRGDEMFMTMAERHGQHVLDHDAEGLLERA